MKTSLSQTLDARRRSEFQAALTLRHCQGLGARTVCGLLRQFGSACAALQALTHFPVRQASLLTEAGIPPSCQEAASSRQAPGGAREAGTVRKRPAFRPKHGGGLLLKASEVLRRNDWQEQARHEWEAALPLHGVQVILWTDSEYPSLLRELPDAPALLYARGDLTLLRSPAVGVVGTRRSSERGRRDASALAGNLAAAGLTIVSGMARGIDRAAHRAAMSLPGGTIAVLGTGIDVIYPAGNADLYGELCARGLVLSEYAPGTRPDAFNFPKRNRIISGLSLGVLVIEAAPRSGSLITARYALEQNRAVYAVGGNIGETGSEGCQELIRQGAQPVFSHLDILHDLQPLLASWPKADPPRDMPQAAPHPSACAHTAAPLPLDGRTDARQAAAAPAFSATARPAAHGGSALSAAARPCTRAGSAPDRDTARLTPAPAIERPGRPQDAAPSSLPADGGQASGRILTELVRHGPLRVDALCERLALPPAVVSAELVMLEVRGHIRLGADGRYAAV